MVKLKRVFTILFLFVVMACGLVAGCKDKYADLKVISDRQEQGVTLYIGEQDKQDTADIVFTVEGAGEDVSTNLKFSFEQNSQTKVVDIVSKVKDGANTIVTVKAINGGETTLVALTEEGGKSCKVKISSVISAKAMELNPSYKGVVVAGGEPLVLNTAQIIKFTPANTTENKISYYLKNQVQGVSVTESGLLTVDQDVTANYVTVVAKNISRNDISNVEFDVKIVEHISDDKVSVVSEGQPIDKIELVSNFEDENKISLSVDVITNEIFDIEFALVDKNDLTNHNVTFVTFLSKLGANAVVAANAAGECVLKIDIVVSGVVAKTILLPVTSVELAKQISVNGNTQDYNENIYTTYNNNLGQEFKVEVGNAFSADRTYFIVVNADDADKITIYNADKSIINPMIKTGATYSSSFDLLQNDTSFYVLGNTPNSSCTISVYAASTFEHKTQTLVNINLSILLGAESIKVNYPNEDISTKTIFVEVGKTVAIDYEVIKENASVLGLDLNTLSDEQSDNYFSYIIDEGVVTIKGIKANKISARLTLPNLVESEIFVICVFKPINEVYASVESPLTSKNIAKVEYNGNQLTSFVMALGVSTQLKFNYEGSLYDLSCQIDDSNIAVVSKDGTVFTKNVGQTTIHVTVATYLTAGNGVRIYQISFDIDLTVYIPIKSINLSSTFENLYYQETLNKTLYDNGAYVANLSLSLYPNNVYVDDENLSITWQSSNPTILQQQASQDKLSRTFVATMGDEQLDSAREYIDVIVNYYGAILTTRCVVNIENPVRAEGLIVSIDGKSEAEIYFDSRKGLSSYNGELENNGIKPADIDVIVYPSNTSDKNVIYSGYDKSVIYVSPDGLVYPIGIGKTQITVTAQDSVPWHGIGYVFEPKVIDVIVADGQTEQTALRINDEQTLLSVKDDILAGNNEYYYYFANDVYLTNALTSFGEFAGSIDGRNHNIYNLKFADANNQYIFDNITGTVKGLNVTASIVCELNDTAIIAVLAKENNGNIKNVAVTLSNFNVQNKAQENSLVLAGVVAYNNGTISGSIVTANLVLTGENLSELTIGLVAAVNNGNMYGNNNNYFYGAGSYQDFDAQGYITTQLTATNSYVGGIVGINSGVVGSNNNGAQLGQGFASNLVINTPNISNVGGIAGYNIGNIYNTLVYGNITANQNVGGVAGVNDTQTIEQDVDGETITFTATGTIQTSVVELYRDAFDSNTYYCISGTQNVGGIAGYLVGEISNSYIISYGENSSVISQGYAGGIAGYAENATIEMSSANLLVSGDIVGGLVGYAKAVLVQDCYSRGELSGTTAAGKIFGEIAADSTIANVYSTIADDSVVLPLDAVVVVDGVDTPATSSTSYFVGKISSGALTVQNSFHLSNGTEDAANAALNADTTNGFAKTNAELTDITTYQNAGWSISAEKSNSATWHISSQNNDEYPVVKYASYLQYKTIASQIFVRKKPNVIADGDVIILNIDKIYNLVDLFDITTDASGINTSILITTDIEGVLNSNSLNSNTAINSQAEQLVTLTFMLQTNTAIQVSVKVLFTKPLSYFEFAKPQITIKVDESEKINGYIFDQTGNLVTDDNYYFGAEWSYDEYIQATNAYSQNGVLYFQNGSVFKALKTYDQEIALTVSLYKKVGDQFINIFGSNQSSSQINKSVELNIVLSRGATDIDIDKKQVSMTVINSITLNVTIKTDNKDEILYIQNNQYVEIVGGVIDNKTVVAFVGSQTTGKEVFDLTLLSAFVDDETNVTTKSFVLELSFKNQYKNLVEEFTYSINTILSFVAKNGEIQHSVDLTLDARPQNLLKIDLLHFPAGKQTTIDSGSGTSTTYNPTEIPSNTLVPGQIGLLAIDLYPEYAFFDELQITTSSDNQGNYINFIQVAYNNGSYVELKPNAEIIPNGIVLSKQSNYSTLNGITYDGKLYVKTLVTSNVSSQTIFTVTLTAFNYERNEIGNIIYGADGKPQTKLATIQKSIEIVVSPNPEVRLMVADADKHEAIVEISGERYDNYYLIAKGQSVSIETITKNFSSNVQYHFSHKGVSFVNNKLYVDSTADIGTTFTLQASVSKTINGMQENYYSTQLQFYIVDYILTDVKFSNGTNNIALENGSRTLLTLELYGIGTEPEDLKNTFQTTSSLWSDEKSGSHYKLENENNGIYFNATSAGSSSLTLKFDYYYKDGSIVVIGTSMTDKVNTKTVNFNVTVIQVTSLENPLPIQTIDQFLSMKGDVDNDWILLEDLVFYADDTATITDPATQTTAAYSPFDLTAKSFDGNCHTITIKGFNTTGKAEEYLGLFTNIEAETVVKNVFVNYEVVGDIKPATGSQIIFGGLAGQNQGIITNSNVTYSIPKDSTNSSYQPVLNFGGDYNTIGGFVGINNGLITYSTAQGKSAIISGSGTISINEKNNFTITSNGDLAGFVCTNSNLIANSQTKYLGLNNTTSANSKAMTAGFVCTNSGSISYSSVAGQLTELLSSNDKGIELSEQDSVRALATNDDRVTTLQDQGLLAQIKDESGANISTHNFAILESKCNIAGFVYRNNKEIIDTYSNIPMKTQARTSGFVFENTSAGSIWTSYTVSYFDGKVVDDNTAHTPFIGTNELGEVQNDSQDIKYCYYISDTSYTELDSRFAQVATAISFSDAKKIASYVGFDIADGDAQSIWKTSLLKGYPLPALQSQYKNDGYLSTNSFQRKYASSKKDDNGVEKYQYYFENAKEGDENNPYLISSPKQFLNIVHFNNKDLNTESKYPTIYIRLINNLDFSGINQTDIEKLQKYIFIGDLDGNGLTISGLRVSGSDEASSTQFGLFKQIGTFDNNKIKQTTIRGLTVSVDEFAKSTSTFAGILSGVVVNTKLKNVEISARNITVLGNNIVGGVAGIILGESSIYNVSSNASVEAAYIGIEDGNYQTSGTPNKFEIDLSTLTSESLKPSVDNKYNKLSYAGGIAGVIALTDSKLSLSGTTYDSIAFRTANIKLAKVSGDVTITAEKVGGLFGYASENVYMANSQFEVSTSDSQKLKGYYVAGGLIAENYGVIYLSKVEVLASAANASDTALTNTTGENLFNAENTNPVYIGGLVGVNYGGYISTSYSKTNVVHYNASYAGGLIGYATNNGKVNQFATDKNGNDILDDAGNKISLYRPTKLEEVYTTGNVFAGANYNEKEEVKDQNGNTVNDKNGNPTFFTSSKNLAGGIFGKLDIILDDLRAEGVGGEYYFNSLGGVLGLNGFYKPYGYTVDSNLNDAGVTYGMLASGFDGTVTLSSGTPQTTTYGATVSAFAGEVTVNSDTTNGSIAVEKAISFGVKENIYRYMFTPFAYNASTISANACSSAAGKEIKMFAQNTGNIILNVDSYNNYNMGKVVKIGSGTTANTKIGDDTIFAPNNAYLLYRSEDVNGKVDKNTINYSDYVQDFNGIYFGWSILTWKCQSPVYPKFIEKDTTGYILIEDEEDLQKINNNYTNYMLVADIFLTKPFTPISTFTGNFESATRTDDAGINGSNFYSIYNINLDTTFDKSLNAVGIFANAESATIKNINFVYGTRIKDPTKTYDETDQNPNNDWGWDDIDENGNSVYTNFAGINASKQDVVNSASVGSIIGFATNCTITNCNIYYANRYYDYEHQLTIDSNASINLSGTYTTASVGSIVGWANNCQISGSFNYGNIVVEPDGKSYTSKCNAVNAPENPIINVDGVTADNLNVGGLYGVVDGTLTAGIETTANYSYINVTNTTVKKNEAVDSGFANIGGLYGKVEVNLEGKDSARVIVPSVTSVKVTVGGAYYELNLGGVVGCADKANLANGTIQKVDISTVAEKTTANNLNIGGFAGKAHTNAVSISGATIDVCTINANATVSGTGENKTENGNANIAGFVGCAGNSLIISKNTLKQFTLDAEGLIGANNTSIGGFGGNIVVSSDPNNNNQNCYVNNIYINLTNAQLGINAYVGGFVGRGEVTLDGGLAKGSIKLPKTIGVDANNNPATIYAAGFVGQFQESNQDSSAGDLTNCFADVTITANATSEILHMAGFANIENNAKIDDNGKNIFAGARVQLDYCISLGDLVYTKGAYTGTASGFVDYVTSSITNCYSMSTLKLLGSDNKKISADYLATFGNSSATIIFSYNLSGAASYYATNENIETYTYTKISKEVQGLITDDYLKNVYGAVDVNDGEYKFTAGTKINPTIEDGVCKYTDYNGTTQYVANAIDVGSKFTLTGATDIAQDTFISGFVFEVDATNYIDTNNGYLFNCLVVSKDNSASNFAANGFANTNKGFINACGTIANINAATTNTTASGFVNTNEGIITNSFANGIMHNVTEAGKNAGFAVTNTGKIVNSYSSTTMFNRNMSTGKAYPNCYGFVYNNTGNLENCYYDTSSTAAAEGSIKGLEARAHNEIYNKDTTTDSNDIKTEYTSLSTLGIKQLQQNSDLSTSATSNGATYAYNYGMPSTVSHKTSLVTSKFEDGEYIVNIKNIAQFQNVMSILSDNNSKATTIIFNLLANLDGKLLTDSSVTSLSLSSKAKGLTGEITLETSITNDTVYTIYGITLSEALFSASEVTLKNVGLAASFVDDVNISVTHNGLFVGEASTLTAKNVYAALTQTATINLTSSNNYFGILAGSVGEAYINNAFTSGNIIVNDKNTSYSTYVGHMIGMQTDDYSKISNVFTSGEITLQSKDSTNNLYVGGILGCMFANTNDKTDTVEQYNVLSNSYSNVAIKNLISTNLDNVYVGAIAGTANHYSKNFGKHIPFYKDTNLSGIVSENNAELTTFINETLGSNNIKQIYKVIKSSYKTISGSNGDDFEFGNEVYEITGAFYHAYAININNVLFDPNISLTTEYLGYIGDKDDYVNNQVDLSSDKIFTQNAFEQNEDKTYNYSDVKDDNNEITKEGLHHFPVQDVFTQTQNINTTKDILNIDTNTETGSRMSPMQLTSLTNDSTYQNNFYYLSENKDFSGYCSLENATLYGRGKTVNITNSNYLFDTIKNSTVTGLTVNNAILANVANNAYIYNCKTTGEINDVSSGFVNTKQSGFTLVIANSEVSATITTKIAPFGGFVGNFGTKADLGCLIKIDKPTLNLTLTWNGNPRGIGGDGVHQAEHIGGIISTGSDYSTIIINSPTINNFYVTYSPTAAGRVEVGGISAYSGMSKLYGDIKIGEMTFKRTGELTTDDFDYVGLLYGNANNEYYLLDKGSYITSDVTFNLNSSSNTSVHAGVVGHIQGGSAFDDLSGRLYNNQTFNISATDFAVVGIGGLAGQIVHTSKINNLTMSNNINVTVEVNYKAEIGGIVGTIGGEDSRASLITCNQSGNVCVTDKSSQTYTRVGGIAGYCYTWGTISGTSSGMVAATSTATSAPNTTGVKDARTWEWVAYNNNNNTKSAYTKHNTYIPLAVGGIYGYLRYRGANQVADVKKSEGAIKALLSADNSAKGLNSDVPNWTGSDDGIDDNNEQIQCRAGGLTGLIQNGEDGKSIYEKDMNDGERYLHVHFENAYAFGANPFYNKFKYNNDGNIVQFGKYFALSNNDIDMPIVTGYSGNKDTSSWNMEKHNGRPKVGNYQPNANSGLSTVKFNNDDIFSSTSLYARYPYAKYDGGKDQLVSITSSYAKGKGAILGSDYSGNNDTYTATSDYVFAGYMYNGTIYNRSYWTFAIDYNYGHQYFAGAHWAGTQIGGEIV